MRSFKCAVAIGLLAACGKSEPAPDKGPIDPPGIELPQLDRGGVPPPTPAPLLVGSRAELTLDGVQVVALHDGEVAAEDKQGGAFGISVRRLGAKLTLPHGPTDALALALDRSLTYNLLLEVLYSAKQPYPHWDHFALLARSGDHRVAIPLVLPTVATEAAANLTAGGGNGGPIDHGSTPDAGTVHFTMASSTGADVIRDKTASVYLAGLKRCYKQLLRSKPTARGTLRIGFTVAKDGRVADPAVHGIDPALETCVLAELNRYRFPIQRDAAGSASESAFSLDLEMTADAGDRPDTATVAPVAPAPDPHADPKLFVAMTATYIVVWSRSGLEGTIEQPLVKIAKSAPTAMTQLGQALAGVVQRRWGSVARPADSRQIIFMANPTEPLQSVASALAAIRATADGKELFPDILLSSGFR